MVREVALNQEATLRELREIKTPVVAYLNPAATEPHFAPEDVTLETLALPHISSRSSTSCSFTRQPRILGGPSHTAHYLRLRSWIIVHTRWNDLQSTYSLSGLVRFPYMMSGFALHVQAMIKLSILHWPLISHTLSLKNIVPVESTFMQACALGDLALVRSLAVARQGYLADVDEMGRPALHVGTTPRGGKMLDNEEIESNHKRVVRNREVPSR